MSISFVIHCDKDRCNSHEQHGRHATLPPGWIEVTEWNHEGARKLHFHTWDCVLFYAGQQPPVEIIPWSIGGH